MPEGLQRSDKKCGTVGFVKRGLFRALCDMDGPTPCCYKDKCVNKTQDQCSCSSCFDMRRRIHAEYAIWRPVNKQCEPKKLSVPEICHLLENSTLYFVGDSLVRHVYTALLLHVTGNDVTGAFAKNIPKSRY